MGAGARSAMPNPFTNKNQIKKKKKKKKKGVLCAHGTFLWVSAHFVYLCCGVVASIYDSNMKLLTLNCRKTENFVEICKLKYGYEMCAFVKKDSVRFSALMHIECALCILNIADNYLRLMRVTLEPKGYTQRVISNVPRAIIALGHQTSDIYISMTCMGFLHHSNRY